MQQIQATLAYGAKFIRATGISCIHVLFYISECRWDMSVRNDQYNGENMRTLHEMKKECVKQKGIDKKKGCIDLPLIDIEPKNCVPDELHLFLRITDIIFNSLFEELVKLDYKSKVHKTGESDHVQRAVRNVRRLGISFNVWMSEGTPGKHSRSALEMTPFIQCPQFPF